MKARSSFRSGIKRVLVSFVAVGTMSGGIIAATALPAHASTTVGYACTLWSNVSLFNSALGTEGCGTQTSTYASSNSAAPSVTLPGNGALTTSTDSNGAMISYGPADFVSGPYDSNDSYGNTGELSATTVASGTTTQSLAKEKSVGPSPFWTGTPNSWVPDGDGPFTTEGYVQAACSSTSTSNTAAVTIINGRVDTALDQDGYPTNTDPVTSSFTSSGTQTINFTIDNISDEEHGQMVFNERTNNGDGSMTTIGAHMYMQGPIAVGEVKYSEVKCGHA